MPKTNAEIQQAWRDRQSGEGKRRLNVWISGATYRKLQRATKTYGSVAKAVEAAVKELKYSGLFFRCESPDNIRLGRV